MKNDCNKIIEENKKSIEEKNNISQKINTAKENENTQVCKTINNYIDKFNCIKPIILSKLDIYLCNDIFEDKE
ncbi:MAG: hypothetical protein U9Q66_00540 [Patescibacteria group bacterium]|nr:hypothetical protein [Patescibacteria group bacterium]